MLSNDPAQEVTIDKLYNNTEDSVDNAKIRSLYYMVIKRSLDFILAIIGVISLLPIIIIAAILVKVESPGPILFKSRRLGMLKKEFYVYKFRTTYFQKLILHDNKKSCEMPIYKSEFDPRVTKIGKILRKASIDELPQLFNIIKGDMSFVGPRPAFPFELLCGERYTAVRFIVKPGLTGLWQIKTKHYSFEEMITLDAEYVRQTSLVTDIKIIFETAFLAYK